MTACRWSHNNEVAELLLEQRADPAIRPGPDLLCIHRTSRLWGAIFRLRGCYSVAAQQSSKREVQSVRQRSSRPLPARARRWPSSYTNQASKSLALGTVKHLIHEVDSLAEHIAKTTDYLGYGPMREHGFKIQEPGLLPRIKS